MFAYPTTKRFLPSKSGELIMMLLHGYFKRTGKPWAYIDQQWMLNKLLIWHKVKMARSTLNYNLKILRENGMIETTTRHHIDPKTNQFVCRVTLYKITKKLRSFFYKIAEYFKRIGWTPSLKALKAGHMPAVGRIETREEAFYEVKRSQCRGSG